MPSGTSARAAELRQQAHNSAAHAGNPAKQCDPALRCMIALLYLSIFGAMAWGSMWPLDVASIIAAILPKRTIIGDQCPPWQCFCSVFCRNSGQISRAHCQSLREKRIMSGQADLSRLAAMDLLYYVVSLRKYPLSRGRHHYWKYLF
jgi:hypothetical protein